MTIHNLLALLAVAALVGCTSVDPDPAFRQVANTVYSRTGKRVQWNRGTAEDTAAYVAVAKLLRRPLTAETAVQIALLNNHNVQATLEGLGIAQADLVEAGLLRNPVFTIERRFPGKALEMDLAEEFIDIILLPLRKRVAADQFEAAKLRVAHEVVKSATNARAAFYRAQGDEQILNLWRTVTGATERSAEAALRLNEAGNTTNLDLANQQAQHIQAKLDYAKAQEDAQNSREQLTAELGLWGTQTNWKIAPRLPEPSWVEESVTGLESCAVAQRLDLAAARYELYVEARRLGFTRVEAITQQLQITAHYEREKEGPQSVGPSLTLPIPIFNQGQAALSRGQARLRQSEQRYLALAVEIRSEVRAARDRMLLARSRVQYYKSTALPLRQRIVTESQLQYNAMQIGVFQLLQAKQDEINSGRGYVEALRDYWVSRADLEKAVGGSFRGKFAPLQTIGSKKIPSYQKL